ncbi:cytosolic carboxypeptidase 2-like isoform X2 [Actinia tenebrosa]|uniref:Cytosolic carboxypeptidase 2-like isoform X2 n=1 Tax=Actinia tenebrosa TaxID=6105 RepID=A0A6P8H8T1_ACTTE|nr:cytosolic carboxypeptidase 2-like isoform X2 [Actinia tenebrosa]
MSSESKRTVEELIFFDKIKKASEYVSEVSERLLAEERVAWNTSKTPLQLREEITKMSEKKAKELFTTEDERQAWIESIRKSVELNLQSQVREFLGTPPNIKKKRLREQKLEEEQRIQSNSQNKTTNTNNRSRSSTIDDNEESFNTKRNPISKKYGLQSYSRIQNGRRTNDEEDLDFDPLSNEFNKHFSPYTRAALESIGNKTSEQSVKPKPYKQAPGSIWVDSQGKSHEIAGPYWPKDHLPLYSNQKHIEKAPDFTEPLNSAAKNIIREEDNSLFPKPWRGTMTVYERSNTKLCPTAPTGCFPSLKFESRFECGNLQQAKRIGRCEYDLILTTDLYTKRHTQWYYFRVENMVPGVSYKFNIVNLLKRDSLYNYGMKPLLYSQKLAGDNNVGWKRTGHGITYSRNTSHKDPLLAKELAYYILSFKVEFPRAGDVCYLAHCYPYSYSDLEFYLRTLVDSPATSQHVRKEVLCKTLAGNNCYVLTITSSQVPDHKKSGVVISARVHPGETNASWMMKGVLDYLTSSDKIAENLRRRFVFKIVPMLNPDGVIVGNYRTNLAAKDLNRTYKEPDKDNFPTVWHTKKMLESFREIHEVSIYCDLHGHSRKPNVFMYGCTEDPKVGSVTNFLEERLFPWMMSQRAPDKFSFQGCKFIVRKCKESTARVVMWRQLGIANSFTMEATFCGANFGDMERGRHFNTRDFQDMGRHFCEVLMEYSEAKSANRNEMTQSFVELACKMTRDILRHSMGNFKRITDNDSNAKTSATTEPNEKEQPINAGQSTQRGIRLAPRLKDVNYIDVDVKQARTIGNPSSRNHDYEVSVKSIHVDSFNDCIKILEGLDLNECYDESDSSDSDSEPGEDESFKKDSNSEIKRKKKKKKKRKENWWESLSKSVPENKEKASEEEQVKTDNTKKVRTSFGKFINPYTNRFNNGIPTYSEERILERAKKKELEKEAAAEEKEKNESQYPLDVSPNESNEAMIAFTNTTELNFVTAQRRLTYYMMNRAQHSNKQNECVRSISHPNLTIMPSKPDIPKVDSFKMDYLDGGGYGFAIRFPAKKNQESEKTTERSDSKSQRQVSLQSFEEARSSADEIEMPSFVEVHARSMSPFRDVRRRKQQPKHEEIPARSKDSSTTRDLETMLRLVNNTQNCKASYVECDYQDELLTEFNRLNMRTRRHDFHRTRNQFSHRKGPSVNNRSTVELRTPVFSSFNDNYSDASSRSNDKKDHAILPEYEPYSSAIPSYSSVGFSSPKNTRKTYR